MGRARGESDLGKPTLKLPPHTNGYAFSALTPTEENVADPFSSTSSLSTVEALSALLLPLPFLFAALNNPVALARHHVHTSRLEIAEEALEEVARSAVPVPDSLLSLVETCVLTAGTLMLVGLWGRVRQPKSAPSRKRKVTLTSATQPGVAPETLSIGGYAKSVLKRIASVALPFLATVEIGGARTGVLLLVAAASGLLGSELSSGEHSIVSRLKETFKSHRGFCFLFAALFLHDVYWHVDGTEYSSTIRGYIALAKSLLILPPPIPTSFSSFTSFGPSRSGFSTPGGPSTPTGARSPVTKTVVRAAMSPMISSAEDTQLTLVSGLVVGVLAFLLSSIGSPLHLLTISNLVLFAASLASAFCLYIFSKPSTLRTPRKLGLVLGLSLCKTSGYLFEIETGPAAFVLVLISVFAYFAALYDDKSSLAAISGLGKDHHDHGHHGHSHSHSHSHEGSRFTKFLLARTEDFPLIHDILSEKESRRIVYFMMINLGFMFVQTFYSVVSGSLGLLSDSIHMFFDCMGLLAGLIASIMSRWPPNEKFPYGYGKVETLSGLGNGIFLMIISVEIIWESIERFMEGAQLKRLTELMVISVGGLLVNLIGLLFIGHAHHHGHDHGHDHGHSHDHANENMVGIYLHILADTMGSVAVIISTILTAYSGWSGWDPIASGIIATLIIAASYPLVVGSARRLLLTVPSETEYRLRNTLQELSNLRGVSGYAVPRFWLDDGDSGHSHGHDHDHDHDHGHSHGHEHKHEHNHSNGHAHSHSHGPDHGHSHGHGHEKHSHSHSTHEHSHDHSHSHDSHDHSHSHSSSHSHSHDSHAHSHDHSHSHDDHSHSHDPEHAQRILGVIHIIASRGADVEDVRARSASFFSARNMGIVVQVDREGAGRCWCNGDKSWTSHNRVSSIVPGLG